jgi:hypothetical protein
MERRVRKAIPEPQQFSLEIHPEFGEREAITDVMKPLRGVTKAKAMRDFPEQFQPKHNSTFFNFDQLPLGFRNKPILMSQEDMGSHGKSFYPFWGWLVRTVSAAPAWACLSDAEEGVGDHQGHLGRPPPKARISVGFGK